MESQREREKLRLERGRKTTEFCDRVMGWGWGWGWGCSCNFGDFLEVLRYSWHMIMSLLRLRCEPPSPLCSTVFRSAKEEYL